VHGDFIRMTNRDWQFSTDEVRRELGLHTLLVVNDFTALAMAIPTFKPDDLMQVGGGACRQCGDRACSVPARASACSGVIPTVDGFVTLGSEGGHVNFAPADEREFAILQYAWRDLAARVERAPDIRPRHGDHLPRAGAPQRPQCARPDFAADHRRRAEGQGRPAVPGSAGVLLRHAGRRCGQPGGHTGRVRRHLHRRRHRAAHGEWFRDSPFRARFEAKGRFSSYLAEIPTYVITTPNPAFYGVATILSEHLRGRSGANTLMERVQHLQHELTPAEQRVAQLVLEQPRLVLNEPIADIARLAEVSQPTVIRFCRSLGFLGLADFKLKFASSLTGAIPVRHSQVRVSDSTHDLSAKVIDNTVSAILKFRDQLDVRSIDRAIAGQQGEEGGVLRDGEFARGGAGRPAQVLPLPYSRPRCTATRTCSALRPICWGRAMW
jgi:glucokinase